MVKKLDSNTKYLIVVSSDFHKLYYYYKYPENYQESDWFPGLPPDMKDLDIANQIFSRDRGLEIEDYKFRKIKTISKNQSFLGLAYNEYFEHPASWELWSVNNPRKIFIYERIE